MVIAQIILLHLCIKVRNEEGYYVKHECRFRLIQQYQVELYRSGDGIDLKATVIKI